VTGCTANFGSSPLPLRMVPTSEPCNATLGLGYIDVLGRQCSQEPRRQLFKGNCFPVLFHHTHRMYRPTPVENIQCMRHTHRALLL